MSVVFSNSINLRNGTANARTYWVLLGTWENTTCDVAGGFETRFWKMIRAPAFGDEGLEFNPIEQISLRR